MRTIPPSAGFNRHKRRAISLLFMSSFGFPNIAFAKDALEAAQDLAGANQSDPNGFTLMIVSISMLFVCALTLIVAASMHIFKKKPKPRTAPSPETGADLNCTSSTNPH